MAPQQPVEAKPKYYSVDEANRSLPLVKAIVSDIVRQFEVVNDHKQRSIELKNLRRRPGSLDDSHAEQTHQIQLSLESEESRLEGFINELNKLGVVLKGFDGLCDFPSLREGREVYLCWRLGELSVRFWHETNAGFAGRQPLDPVPITDNRRG